MSGWSALDLIHLTFTPLLAIINLPPDPILKPYRQGYLAATITIVLVAKLFDWLRLFDGTSFYILLIKKTVAQV